MMWLIPSMMGLIIFGATRGNVLKRLLSFQFVTVIGGMCYSIYLIHYPIFSFIAERLQLRRYGEWEASLRLGMVALPIVLVVGVAFFVTVERPCMNPNWPRDLLVRIKSLLRIRHKA